MDFRSCVLVSGDATTDSRCLRFARVLTSFGRVTVLAPGDSETERELEPGIHLQTMAAPRGSLRRRLAWFWQHAPGTPAARAAGLCLASDLYVLPAAARAAARNRVPLCFDSRELYPSIASLVARPVTRVFWRAVEQRYASRAQTIFTVNDSIAEILRGRYPRVPVELARNYPSSSSRLPGIDVRASLGVPAEAVLFLSLGGVQDGRGASLYLRAMREVSDAHLLFLGQGDTGQLAEEARVLGVEPRVHFLPAVPSAEVVATAARADVGLCVIENRGRSYYLSLPNKLFEYLAAGLPVIASNFPELSRVVHEGQCGVLVNPSDETTIVAAFRDLAGSRNTRLQLAAAAARASRNYDADAEHDRVTRVISDLLHAGV
ncbi:MAG: glycosyltransferase [Ignavibacteriae bacterium]|nr:glycosyltransferase [Ignavibacteriota bacterium]